MSEDDVLDFLHRRENQGEHVFTTADVAEEFDVTRKTALDRLDNLEAEGRVGSKEAGRARVWWPTDDTQATHSSDESGGSSDEQPLATAGGAPADGQYGDLVEGMNELRRSHAETQAKIEQMEEEVARAQNQDDQQSEDTAEVVDRQIQKHEHTNRVNDAADRGAVTFISSIAFTLWGEFLGGGETVTTIAGVLLIYAIYQWGKYIYLRVQGPETDESVVSEESSAAANGEAGAR